MKTIDLTTNSWGNMIYPMQQLTDQLLGTVTFVGLEKPEAGDTIKFIAGQSNYPEKTISEVIEERKPKGRHSHKDAMFYKVQYA